VSKNERQAPKLPIAVPSFGVKIKCSYYHGCVDS
jgi:hypothetical protein